MQMIDSTRHIRILLLVLFVCTSLSPDIFVLCTGDCHAAGAEPIHVVYIACVAEETHRCESSDTCETDLVHHPHRTGVPLPRDLSHAQGRPDISKLEDLPVSSLSVHTGGLCSDRASDRPVTGATTHIAERSSTLEHLQVVILLI